jgi:hypothetical protein
MPVQIQPGKTGRTWDSLAGLAPAARRRRTKPTVHAFAYTLSGFSTSSNLQEPATSRAARDPRIAGGTSVQLLAHEDKAKADALAAEELQKSTGAKMVKAFNTTFAGTLASGNVAGQQPEFQWNSALKVVPAS